MVPQRPWQPMKQKTKDSRGSCSRKNGALRGQFAPAAGRDRPLVHMSMTTTTTLRVMSLGNSCVLRATYGPTVDQLREGAQVRLPGLGFQTLWTSFRRRLTQWEGDFSIEAAMASRVAAMASRVTLAITFRTELWHHTSPCWSYPSVLDLPCRKHSTPRQFVLCLNARGATTKNNVPCV